MSRGDTRAVPREHARGALDKCLEFLATANVSLQSTRWNAASLNAIHSGISAADAVLIHVAAKRSIARDHGAVIDLLESEPSGQFTATQRRQLTGLLKVKNQVAYEQRLLTETEARQLVDHATRLTKWATSVTGDRNPL